MADILVIDDDDLSRSYLSTVLARAGHTVYEAENGQQCLQQIARTPIDLTIVDIFMPAMDGFELMAAILKEHPDGKVVAMSGGGAAMDQTLALQAAKKFGAIGLLRKPFERNRVIHTVNLALGIGTETEYVR